MILKKLIIAVLFWNIMLTHLMMNQFVRTSLTEGSRISRWATVTGKAVGSLHTASLVLAECAVAAAVTWTTSLDPWGDLCSLLQVQGDTVQPQRANAAVETLLPGCCPT